jgi:hypothetical protein
MSQFINGSYGLPVTIHAPSDISVCDQIYWGTRSRAPTSIWASELRIRADNARDSFVFKTRWWPKCGQILGGWGDGTQGDTFQNLATRAMLVRTERGANGRLGFVGYTRDQYGSAVGGCTVRLYRVISDELVAKVVSDANGLYFATTPYSDEHFLVIHSGSLAGATKANLFPA